MPKIHVTTQQGETRILEAGTGARLMEVLNTETLVDATCGGAASCGTCHVYFADTDLAGTRTEDEIYMLESLSDYVAIKSGSRLSCQVILGDRHEGARITIAPQA